MLRNIILQLQIEAAVQRAVEEGLKVMAQDCSINLEELSGVLQPIIESCTKDAISAGKNYIFSHSISIKHAEVRNIESATVAIIDSF